MGEITTAQIPVTAQGYCDMTFQGRVAMWVIRQRKAIVKRGWNVGLTVGEGVHNANNKPAWSQVDA